MCFRLASPLFPVCCHTHVHRVCISHVSQNKVLRTGRVSQENKVCTRKRSRGHTGRKNASNPPAGARGSVAPRVGGGAVHDTGAWRPEIVRSIPPPLPSKNYCGGGNPRPLSPQAPDFLRLDLFHTLPHTPEYVVSVPDPVFHVPPTTTHKQDPTGIPCLHMGSPDLPDCRVRPKHTHHMHACTHVCTYARKVTKREQGWQDMGKEKKPNFSTLWEVCRM